MSNTDHPRIKGTHRAGRSDGCQGCYWCGRKPDGLTKRQAIVESLAEPEPERMVGDGLSAAGQIDWWKRQPEPDERYEEPLADWERELLGWSEPVQSEPEWEPLADWERELLNGEPEYSCSDHHDCSPFRLDCEQYEEPEQEDWPEDEFDRHWLATPTSEFFDALGDAWVIEGPNPVRPEPLREGNYVRVWQLAEDLCVESKHVVEVLRLAGEYVKTHQSWVARPVAEAVMLGREWIVAKYGEREDRAPGNTLRMLLLQEGQRAKAPRPEPIPVPDAGMGPRPGRNPFLPVPKRAPRPTPRPGNRPTTSLSNRPGPNPFTSRSM